MKSYFAKLADRATLANVPASSPVYTARVSDPFEEASPEQSQLPPLHSKNTQRTFHDPEGFALSPQSDKHRAEQSGIVHERDKRDSAENPVERQTLQPRPSEEVVVNKLESKNADSIDSRPAQAVAEEHTIETEVRAVVSLLPNKTSEAQPISSHDSSRDQEPLAEQQESVADLRVEEALLLRKADLFMSRLLDGTRETLTQVGDESTETARSTISRLEKEPVSRLEPVQKNPPPAIQEPDGPSLVIGKLTVEIAPPTPAPVTPQPQRIVVRGSRGRGSGFKSSRRFGLRQF
jgi:hypothetical protein